MKHRGGTDFCQLLNVSPICARFPLCSELHVGVISLFPFYFVFFVPRWVEAQCAAYMVFIWVNVIEG